MKAVYRFRFLAAVLGFVFAGPVGSFAAQARNVVLILSDDQGYAELGPFLEYAAAADAQPADPEAFEAFLGSPGGREAYQLTLDCVRRATPNLGRLAKDGLRFTNFYAAPTCGPSRAALMSARYPQRWGQYSNLDLAVGVPAEVVYPVRAFRDAGYATGVFGKWHLGDKPGQHPNDKGFESYFGYDRAHTEKYGSKILFRDRDKVAAEGWLCDQITGEALGFLDRAAAERRPFFLFVSYCEPKPPAETPPQRYMDAIASGSRLLDSHFGSLYGMDHGIGRIRSKLAEIGVAERTMIIFASDNGLNKGVFQKHPDFRGRAAVQNPEERSALPGNGALRGCKWTGWDGGVKTPMLAHVPGGPSGDCAALVSIMDILPTALDYAGLEAPAGDPVDGASFLAHFESPGREAEDRTLFWASLDGVPLGGAGLDAFGPVVAAFKSRKRGQPDYFGNWYVRRGPWKLVGWNGEAPMLFNIEDDIGERYDLSARNPERVRRLHRDYLEWAADNIPPVRNKREYWETLYLPETVD